MFSHGMQVMNGIVWGPPMILLLIGTGLFLTIRLRGIQLRHFRHAIECISGKASSPCWASMGLRSGNRKTASGA